MISKELLNRKIKESNIEEISERLCMKMSPQSFVEVLAECSREVAGNPLFKPYISDIGEKEKTYRQEPKIAAIIRKATFNPTGQQILDQKMLARNERISEYFSLWLIIRFNELYDISLHNRVRNELTESGNLRDLADFEAGVIVISNILEGNSNVNLSDYYLPHAHRVISGITQFFDKQRSISIQDQNMHEKILPIKQTLENDEAQALDSCFKKKSKEQNKTFKPSKHPVTIKKTLDKKKILLSTDGKEDIPLELFKKDKPSEHTNQIKFFFEIIKGPTSKYKLNEILKLNNKQIEKAYSTINILVSDYWKISEKYVIYDKRHGEYCINSNYPTNFENL